MSTKRKFRGTVEEGMDLLEIKVKDNIGVHGPSKKFISRDERLEGHGSKTQRR